MRHRAKYLLHTLAVLLLFHLTSELESQITHTYTLGEYYYMTLIDSANYELKIGMYGDRKLNGTYESRNDTLTLETFEFVDKHGYISQNERAAIINRFGRYLIKDSLLIPICFFELEIPTPAYIKRDTSSSDWYMLTDGHVLFQMILKPDSIFNYYTGSDKGGQRIYGTWSRIDDHLYLNPQTKEHLEVLEWICSKNRMLFYNKFLIGKTTDEDRYMYLLKR